MNHPYYFAGTMLAHTATGYYDQISLCGLPYITFIENHTQGSSTKIKRKGAVIMNKYAGKAIEILRSHREAFEASAEMQLRLWNGEKPAAQPLLLHCRTKSAPVEGMPSYNTKETHYDSEKMLTDQLNGALTVAAANSRGPVGSVPSVRANMGCGIFPTLLGVRQELFEDKMPWVLEHKSKEELSKMGPEDIKLSDEFKAGLEHMAYMAEKLEGTGCLVFPMDLQGAFDTAHIVYGDDIFYDLYDDPRFVHHLLELSCEAIFMGMDECLKVMPRSEKMIAHYNELVIPRSMGGIKISEDTSTLLSKDHIEEFVVPYMNRILDRFGGGYIHYCGSNPHLYDAVMKSEKAYGINFGNPEKNDIMRVLKDCAERGKIYYGAVGPVIDDSTDESLTNSFAELLKASRKDGRSLLLLQYSCGDDRLDSVIECWNRANEAVDRLYA